jgi:hypothetical protein
MSRYPGDYEIMIGRADFLVELRGFKPMAIASAVRAIPPFAAQCAQPACGPRFSWTDRSAPAGCRSCATNSRLIILSWTGVIKHVIAPSGYYYIVCAVNPADWPFFIVPKNRKTSPRPLREHIALSGPGPPSFERLDTRLIN